MTLNLRKFKQRTTWVVTTAILLAIVSVVLGYNLYKAHTVIKSQDARLDTAQGHLERTQQLLGKDLMNSLIYQVDDKGAPLYGYDKQGNQNFHEITGGKDNE